MITNPSRKALTINPCDPGLKVAGLKWILLALIEEKRDATTKEIEQFAEGIHAVALDWVIPVEEAIRWIHSDQLKTGLEGWVIHCREYARLRTLYCTQDGAALPPRLE